MNFWQRALKSVTRRKGKSFILFLVIFILGNVIAGAVAIQQSTVNVEKETKKKMGALATVEFDYEKYAKDSGEAEEADGENFPKPPSTKVYNQIGELAYVKYYDYTATNYIETKKIVSYVLEDGSMGMTSQYFSIKGGNRSQPLDLEEGKIKLLEGETFSEKDLSDEHSNSVIISQEVAEKNNLKVGDQVVLDIHGQKYPEISEEEGSETDLSEVEPEKVTFDYPVKIIGIFSVIKKENTEKGSKDEELSQSWQAVDQMNTIYGTNKMVTDLTKQQQEKIYGMDPSEFSENDFTQAIYVLKSPDDVTAFKQEATAYLPNYYVVTASSDEYDQIASGMKKLGSISQYVVIIAAVATIFIVSLVVLLFLRDRKHELGIYLSLGESRGKVIGQIVLEVLLISVAALVLSLITGNFLGSIVSKSLMQSDWINASDQMGYFYSSVYTNSQMTFSDIKSAYKVSFTPLYIVTYLLVGLGTVVLSTILPLLYILRLNPKKIMM